MAGQPPADFFDSRHNTACEIALPESLSHGAGDVIPKLLAHFLVYAAASQHDEPVARRHHKEQYGVTILGRSEAQSLEYALGGLPNITPERR
jgi:hypothetical protein